ncbi:threonylcarbamoyl-AMP synthase isoform X3 [Erinaceus europaeus]|uniref:Threonylcarbamoyl-AMP synthase n=1 Tax=Erinaceus europaeus TaxID=9365 RepID=A0ABM3WTS1_ERIEU|nr:threonylcarbamoyl-AMP synthase isoform X3 [Erinaceus europaeus]
MSPARRCRGLRAAVAASVGLSEGPAASARSGRRLRPPSPTPGARLWRLPGGGAVRAASPERSGWTEALRAAVAELRAGAVVAVPTDTLYGLACSASCSAALGAVYRLKGRSQAKPLAVCLGRVADVYRYCHVQVPEGLLQDLLPGPVTLVMERSEELHKDLNPFTPCLGKHYSHSPTEVWTKSFPWTLLVRMDVSGLCRELSRKAGGAKHKDQWKDPGSSPRPPTCRGVTSQAVRQVCRCPSFSPPVCLTLLSPLLCVLSNNDNNKTKGNKRK